MIVPGSANSLLLAGGGYQISRSVRFRSSASTYFNRTPASAGNRRTWTWSGWIKRGDTANNSGSGASTELTIFGSGTNVSTGNGVCSLGITGGVNFQVWQYIAGTQWNVVTTQVFRDYSAWYHIVIAVDTTQATASNRVKMYVNGVQVTDFGTASYPTQNYDTGINSTDAHNIGRRPDASNYWGGYLTEINFIDGQALTPSSFGENNAITGVWQPKKYTGTYGTNGFYLNFSDNSAATAAAIGKDYSGNGNNWTPNNISVTAGVTYDSMLDVPTPWADGGNGRGNYAVFNPLAVTAVAATFAEGNLKVTTGLAGGNGYGTIAVPASGKWYWEVTAGSANSPMIGISAYLSTQTYAWQNGSSVFYYSSGQKYVDGTASAYGASYTTNDVIGIAVDVGAGTITFYKNNVSQGTITHAVTDLYPCLTDGASATTDTFYANFGQRPFTYTPPSGFTALNTQNLPTPTINNGAKYMAATLWTGNSASRNIQNSGSMQPDLVWIKNRSTTAWHVLFDAQRGTGKELNSNSTSAETTNNIFGYLNSFNADGFGLVSGSTGYDNVNKTGESYVGWQWKKGATQGFDIVTCTTNGSGIITSTSHALGVTPSMIILKARTGTDAWYVYHKNSTATATQGTLNLNTTSAVNTTNGNSGGVDKWTVSSSAFAAGNAAWTYQANTNHIAYLFSEVAGFSKFGSYTGNGSADGPFVFTNFRPRFVLIKNTSGADDWFIKDTARSPYNTMNEILYPNNSNAEGSRVPLDCLSNGFKIRDSASNQNTNGSTYIYAAFAESPFSYSLAR